MPKPIFTNEMLENKQKLSGIFVPLTTPFGRDEVLYAELAENVKHYNQTRLNGYMILGGNGEYLGLTEEESLKIVRTVVKNKTSDKSAVVGVGRESAYATLQFIEKAAAVGAEYASTITPFYYAKHMKDDALVRYFEKIADQSPIPLVIYNSPEFAAGVRISPHAISQLCTHPNIVLMKNSSNGSNTDYLQVISANTDFYLHTGRIKTLFVGLSEGVIGATLSTAIYLPDLCCEAFDLFSNGEVEKSKALCEKLMRIGRTVSEFGVSGVKATMSMTGYIGGDLRLPLISLSDEQKNRIKTILSEEGIL